MVAVSARLLRPPQSVDTPQQVVPGDTDLCGNREWGKGVCDTTIPHCNPLVVMVIIDGCPRCTPISAYIDEAIRRFDGAAHACT